VISPARPGSRDPKGGMALSVWVRHVAPALRPERPSLSVAVEWPIETRIPWPASEETKAAESGSSGAMVASLTEEDRFEEP
jgi:hypothetical protein